MICKGCGITKCALQVNEQYPLQIACPTCDEHGCSECDEEGWIRITQCPKTIVDREIMSFIELADYAKNGLFPVSGGALEQSQSFLAACRFLWSEDNRAEMQQMDKK